MKYSVSVIYKICFNWPSDTVRTQRYSNVYTPSSQCYGRWNKVVCVQGIGIKWFLIKTKFEEEYDSTIFWENYATKLRVRVATHTGKTEKYLNILEKNRYLIILNFGNIGIFPIYTWKWSKYTWIYWNFNLKMSCHPEGPPVLL